MSLAEKLPISCLVLTKNEASGLAGCLGSLGDFGQVVVVDSGSTDGTQEIARAHGAEVIDFVWNGLYPKKKQWMLDHPVARHDWVLFLDGDERPTPQLIEELDGLRGELDRRDFVAYDLVLDYVFDGRTLRYGHRVTKRSLVDRTRVRFPEIDDLDAPGIGEVEGHYQPELAGPLRTLSGHLIHDDRDPIRSWFDRHNRYSDWEAYLGTHPSVASVVNASRSSQGQRFAKVPFKPLAFFVYDYIVRQGFRDGRAGFNYAVALSWYYWLTDVKVREARRNSRDR